MKYTNLHLHGYYSNVGAGMLDAYGSIDQIVDHCKDIGYEAVALTDHGGVSGHIELIRKCKEEKLKPICGCEMYVTDDIELMKKVREKLPLTDKENNQSDENQKYTDDEKQRARQKMHFNVLAKNQKGLRTLWSLVSKSWEEGFYFKPTTDWNSLAEHKDNLFFGTACEVGPLGRGIDKIKYDGEKKGESQEVWMKKALEFTVQRLQKLKDLFGDSLYVEIIPIPEDRARWKYLLSYQAAKKVGVLALATNDSHAPRKEDTKYQDMLYCAGQYRNNKEATYYNEDRNRYTPELFYIHSADEMLERMVNTFPEITKEEHILLIENTQKVVDKIETVYEPKVPAVAYSDIHDTKDKKLNLYKDIQVKIKEGWLFRGLDKLEGDKKELYEKRLKRELEVVLNKGYIDYFLIMQDIMNWCETDRPVIENFDLWFDLNHHIYKDKTKEELRQILDEKKYFDKKETIGTGIARGSAGGSLITYLLRITNIDPMPGELLFERFIDYTRGNVYYEQDFDIYSKKQFKIDFPEENKERVTTLRNKWINIIKTKINTFLQENSWYDDKQVNREFWLLEHNQQFSREEEYFFTICEKIEKGEITTQTNKNPTHSILAYIMNITKTLTKEDYVVNLTDIPDIDSDFEDKRRNEVYIYLQNRYGLHNSARIATYTFLKDKSVVDLLARIFPTSIQTVKEIKEQIEEYKKENDISELKSLKSKDFKDFTENFLPKHLKNIEFLKYAPSLLGQLVAWGMHAAGMIVHNNNMSNYGAMYQNKDKETGNRTPVLCWDSRIAESMGLMKLDLLGLNSVTNLKEINKLVEERHGYKHHWQRIDGIFEDQKTKDLVKDSKNWTGLFQFEGFTMTLLGKEIKPDNFEDLILVNAGGRPGPLQEAMKFGKIKRGELKPYYYKNDIYKKITEKRGGILIYQEDIMQVAWQMCKYDDAMVGKIRKYISKSKKDDLDKLRPSFIKKLIENAGMEEEEATKLWKSMEEFGRYAFNKAHSEAYSLLAYSQAYYKANYPLEFFTGMVKTLGKVSGKVVGTNKDKVYMLLKDFESKGYKIFGPDINESTNSFEIVKDPQTNTEGLRVGFDYITGIGTKQAYKIQTNKPYKDYFEFVEKSGANSKIVNICKQLGMFNNIGGAPDIDEKIIPSLTLLEDLIKINNLCADAIAKDIIFITELRNLLIISGIKQELVDSYILTKKGDNNVFDLKDLKKIKARITSKIKSLSLKFKKEVIENDKIKKAGDLNNDTTLKYQDILLEQKDIIDITFKEIEYQEKYYNKNKTYDISNTEDEVVNRIRENISTKNEEIIENNKSCCLEGGCDSIKAKINLLKSIFIPTINKTNQILEEILNGLGLSTDLVIINPNYKSYLNYCPILAKANIDKYKNVLPFLKNYVSLKTLDYTKNLYDSVFAGVITDKRVLPDSGNPKKMRVSLNIRIDGYSHGIFVNGHSYNKNEEILNIIEPGDAVFVIGNISDNGFNMIQLTQISKIKPIYESMKKIYFIKQKKQALLKKENKTEEDLAFLDKIKGLDVRNLFSLQELNFLNF